MKIVDAYVHNARQVGAYEDPILQVRVNEPVFEQAQPIFDGSKCLQYRLIPCGPFYAVEYRENKGMTYGPWSDYAEQLPLGSFGNLNTSGLIKYQLMPVQVVTPEETIDLAMDVTRARRLVRKYELDPRWEIIVDEQAALLGSLQWRVELRHPMCYGGATPRQAHCTQPPTTTIVYKGTHLTLCEDHLRDHQLRMARQRQIVRN